MVRQKDKNSEDPVVSIDIIRLDDSPVDIRPAETINLKYYLWALAFFLLIFVSYIGYSFHHAKVTRIITVTVPAGTELYYESERLQHMKNQNDDITLYSLRLPYGTHTLTAVDSDKKKYTLQFEIGENDPQSRSYIFSEGTFLKY